MRWRNTSTSTLAGAAGTGLGPSSKPAVVEQFDAVDDAGNIIASIIKAVDGTITMEINGEVVPALDSISSTEFGYLNGVSANVQTQLDSRMITKIVTFTENATATTHTGTVAIPAGAVLHNIQVMSSVLWTGGTAVMKVGDTADDDGYFTGIDLKATDLLVGEVLDTSPSTSWGGKEGAYLVAATGRRGPTSNNFAKYYAAGSNIVGVVTVGTPATTAGRTFMVVSYSIGEVVAAVAA